jgi:hypothetical protein
MTSLMNHKTMVQTLSTTDILARFMARDDSFRTTVRVIPIAQVQGYAECQRVLFQEQLTLPQRKR